MNVGMRVRGGLFAALIVCAMPVAATLAGMLVASSAAAQSVASSVLMTTAYVYAAPISTTKIAHQNVRQTFEIVIRNCVGAGSVPPSSL